MLQQKGGIEKRFQNYLEEFVKRGFHVSVLYASEKSNYHRVEKVAYQRVPIGIVPFRSLRKIFFARKVDKVLLSAEYEKDLKLSMGRTGKADIVIAAGNYPETNPSDISASNWFYHPMYYLDKESFKSSGIIMAASTQVKNELKKLFDISDSKINVLHPPVKSKDFYVMTATEKQQVADKHKVDHTKTNFLFVSTGHKRKGLGFLLDIFAELDPDRYELFVAGNKFESRLKNVHSLGFQQNTNELYNMVDCLLHPASYEAFGQVITESLLCGTPVLVSDRVGAKEIIENGSGKVLPFEITDRWLTAIKEVRKKGDEIQIGHIRGELDIAVHIDKMLAGWKNYNN